LRYDNTTSQFGSDFKYLAFSVRCIQN
jgi:hypothetical protein